MTDHGNLVTQWLAVAAAGFIVTVVMSFLRDRAHTRRERTLEVSVRQRTEELESERLRETRRNRILEMLVSNNSLGTVLDEIVRMLRSEAPGVYCAILLKRSDAWYLGASADLPKEWVTALHLPHAIPFEVWKQACSFLSPAADPAWRTFASALSASCPAAIRSQPIGATDPAMGAILLFQLNGDEPKPDLIETAARLAQVAVEHSRFYEDLNFQAHHDSLTGLPNRALFDDRLDRAVNEAARSGTKVAVVFVDLDRFKQINDSLSHRVGDLLLREMARRMKREVRPSDTVARIGGDEFNILIPSVSSLSDAEEIAGRILGAIRQPMIVEGHAMTLSASLGIAMFPDDGTEADALQRQADAAMYCAKGLGRDRVQAFSARNEKLDRVRMEQELRTALREGWFAVHYQPKIGADGHFGGVEALIRLKLPSYGNVSPGEFIPIAEESGLIVPLGAWVLNEVCRQIAEWRAEGLGHIAVAVNVSPAQICRGDFSDTVLACLKKHGVEAAELELELTESLLIGGGSEAQRQMNNLRAVGIQFSIDDFGTGYSSLSYLHRLPVDTIKLDRSFVQSVDTDDAARRLVQAMIGVAQGLGLKVIAEGVETESQRTTLIAAGCPMMQGFLFARPQPASDLSAYLRRRAPETEDLLLIESAVSPASAHDPDLLAV